MMEMFGLFVIIVLGSALGFLLGVVVLYAIFMNEKVMYLYMNKISKMSEKIIEKMYF